MKADKYMFYGKNFIILTNSLAFGDVEILKDVISQQDGAAKIITLPL